MACTPWILTTDDGLVTWIARPAAEALEVIGLLAIAGERDSVKKGFLKLLLQRLVELLCLAAQSIKGPGFGHPASRDWIDHARRDRPSVGQLRTTNQMKGLPHLL